jgi:tRNA A-37 threonylcarbamoyl transferase component Bud32
MLQLAAASGISVPYAVAYAHRGRLFYRAWLITGEINRPKSLVEISRQTPEKLPEVMPRVGQQVSLLIQHRIRHVDLHPGNIVVDPAGNVFLLDFDKSKIHPDDKDQLLKRYLARWQRAVKKHRLPDSLIEMMQDTIEPPIGGR